MKNIVAKTIALVMMAGVCGVDAQAQTAPSASNQQLAPTRFNLTVTRSIDVVPDAEFGSDKPHDKRSPYLYDSEPQS